MEHTQSRPIERRSAQIFVTQNTEYYVRDERCVAVRDRRSRQWYGDHQALSRRIVGVMVFNRNGSVLTKESGPTVGDSLCFENGPVSSAIISIERPSREVGARLSAS